MGPVRSNDESSAGWAFPLGQTRVMHIVAAGLVIWALGCADVEWGRWGERSPRNDAIRPASQADRSERRRANPFAETDSAAETTAVRAQPNDSMVRDPADRLLKTEDKSGTKYHRLILVSGTKTEEETNDAEDLGAGVARVRVRRASARRVGELLSELYVPVGPGGSEDRYFLVYKSAEMMQAASRLALRMDMDAEDITTGPEIEPLEAFVSAVPLYYELLHRRYDPKLADELAVRLEYAARSERVPEELRWASAMIAARIHADHRADVSAQKRDLLLASVSVPDDSLESFLAQAALVHWYADADRPDVAAEMARELVVRFEQFSDTFAYEECCGSRAAAP